MVLSRAHVVTAALGALALTAAAVGVASASTPAPSGAAAAPAATTLSTTTSAGSTAPASTSGAPGPATPTKENERCAADLPDRVLGSPAVRAGDASGVRVWHDGTGWHLRVTHPGTGTQVFTGAVRSGQPITAKGVLLEAQDSFTLSADQRVLTFRLVNHGRLDGIDFTDRCAIRTGFAFQRDGKALPTSAVDLGRHGVHPASDPFTVLRRR